MNKYLLLITIGIVSSCKSSVRNPNYIYVKNQLDKDSIHVEYNLLDLMSLTGDLPPQRKNDFLSIMLFDPLFCANCRINKYSHSISVIIPPKDSIAICDIDVSGFPKPALWLTVASTKISMMSNDSMNGHKIISGLVLPAPLHQSKTNDYYLPINDSFFKQQEPLDSMTYFSHPSDPDPLKRRFIYTIIKGLNDTLFCYAIEKCDSLFPDLYRFDTKLKYHNGREWNLGGKMEPCKQ